MKKLLLITSLIIAFTRGVCNNPDGVDLLHEGAAYVEYRASSSGNTMIYTANDARAPSYATSYDYVIIVRASTLTASKLGKLTTDILKSAETDNQFEGKNSSNYAYAIRITNDKREVIREMLMDRLTPTGTMNGCPVRLEKETWWALRRIFSEIHRKVDDTSLSYPFNIE